MKLTVTKECIELGNRSSAYHCPIAIALKRKVLGKKKVPRLLPGTYVGTEVLAVDGDAYTLPKSAREFIDRFDSFKPVKPFTFTARRAKP